jgi:Tfp pilus assembly protein PilF
LLAVYFGLVATVDASFQPAAVRGAARILALANLFLAAESLVPFVLSSAYGKIPSDGLALFQIVFRRQIPHVPQGNARPASPRQRMVRLGLKWFGITFLAFCFGLCIALAFLLFWNPGRGTSQKLWVAALLLLGLAAGLAWAISRVWQTPIVKGASSPSETRTDNTTRSVSNQVVITDPWYGDPKFVGVLEKVQALMKNQEWATARKMAEAALAQCPNSMLLQLVRAETLRNAGDFREAEEQYAILLRDFDPGIETRAAWTCERLKTVIGQRDYERARALGEEAVREMIGKEHKINLMDRLACLPIMDGTRDYLDEAYKWCEQALELAPENLTLLGTKGSLLIELGHIGEGVPLLEKVYKTSEARIDKGISALYLGLAASSAGELTAAKQWADEARKWFPEPWLLQRLEEARPG